MNIFVKEIRAFSMVKCSDFLYKSEECSLSADKNNQITGVGKLYYGYNLQNSERMIKYDMETEAACPKGESRPLIFYKTSGLF